MSGSLPSEWTVTPSGPLRGEVRVPGDKSISHRSVLFNALAGGPARVRNVLRSEDLDASMAAVQAMGVAFDRDGADLIVRPPATLREPDGVIDCGNSGTSIRLLAGIAAASPHLTVLTGDASLRKRPMKRVIEPLRRMGARIDARDDGRLAPLVVRGGSLHAEAHDLAVASAQIKTAILLAGLGTGASVREPHTSRDHSERMLAAMGVPLHHRDGWLVAEPIDRLRPLDVDVPGDISAAAFFLVAATLVAGSEVRLVDVGVNPTRAGVLDALRLMGADVEVIPAAGAGAEPRADLVARHATLRGTRIDGELALRCIDELPVLAVAAAFAVGETVIADAAELRVKESDRIARVAGGLRALGVEVEEFPDGMRILGGRPRGPAVIDAALDHRIAMSFAVAALASDGPVTLRGADAMASSYPEFPKHLGGLLGA